MDRQRRYLCAGEMRLNSVASRSQRSYRTGREEGSMQPQSVEEREQLICFGRISGPLIGPQWGDEDDRDDDEHEKNEKDDDLKPRTGVAPEE